MCLTTQGRIFWPIFAAVYISFLVWGCYGNRSGTHQPARNPAKEEAGNEANGSQPDPEGDDQRLERPHTVGESRPLDAAYPEALYR